MGTKDKDQNFSFCLVQDQNSILGLRKDYLDSLPAEQEYYLELLIKNAGTYHTIQQNGRTVGYFIVTAEGTLLEYHVFPDWAAAVDEIFARLKKEFQFKNALVKSFDATMLSCCYGFQKHTHEIGILFRDYVDKPAIQPDPDVTVRLALLEDESKIISVNEEVFDHPDEVKPYILSKQLFLFEKQREMVGFGIYSQIFPERPAYDIGMLVVPGFRKQGYGTYILHYLVNFCRQNGWRFSAGCAIHNRASRKCLENAGFIARYRLLEFNF